MCGVIGLVYERARPDLGEIAAELLQTLEYRGYDSSGVAVQGADGERVVLKKGVGAPSVLVDTLGIRALAGRVLCGQVRWATFGSVDEANAQPHVVGCHAPLYGAHNGNVTNCDELKAWLTTEGHDVASDNDGEMVVHAVEHFFARELAALPVVRRSDAAARRTAMRAAVRRAAARLEGSYAAVVVDPATGCAWAVKAGSSLYCGRGESTEGGAFGIASSDLSAVLRLTRTLVPIAEGEMVELDATSATVHALEGDAAARDAPLPRPPVESRLRAEDTALRPPFETFMDQEISDQEATCRTLVDLFRGRAAAEDVAATEDAVRRFVDLVEDGRRRGGRLLAVCCGSSYHAACAAALFFDEIAHLQLAPVLPGDYRGRHRRSLVDGDVVVAVSQSGETKDLIDVLDDVAASGRDVRRVAVVNNVNSTLAQEKSDLVLPLHCGPEVAVPATKSFMSQMTLFYCLAIRLARARGTAPAEALAAREATLDRLPGLVRETFDSTRDAVAEAAELLYLRPSIQVLATRIAAVALEGALKIREVVLNHTEGCEGSEFKHGPNTILGWNTVLGPEQVEALLARLGTELEGTVAAAVARGDDPAGLGALARRATAEVFAPPAGTPLLDRDAVLDALYADYPLVYVTGPSARDVGLTVSQINTHKIRGALSVVVAEEDPDLRQAAAKAPAGRRGYRSVYVALPATGDDLLPVFSATVVLQRLALEMSLRKARYLDHLGIRDHGVHPDVPKNVSKSITVD